MCAEVQSVFCKKLVMGPEKIEVVNIAHVILCTGRRQPCVNIQQPTEMLNATMTDRSGARYEI